MQYKVKLKFKNRILGINRGNIDPILTIFDITTYYLQKKYAL